MVFLNIFSLFEELPFPKKEEKKKKKGNEKEKETGEERKTVC